MALQSLAVGANRKDHPAPCLFKMAQVELEDFKECIE